MENVDVDDLGNLILLFKIVKQEIKLFEKQLKILIDKIDKK